MKVRHVTFGPASKNNRLHRQLGKMEIAHDLLHWRVVMTSPEDLVSVIIPAYNAEATLAATIASVRAQTHQALEILIVDDGSTDRTGAIAAAVAVEDSRVRVLTIPNGGVARARNAGAAECSGAFLAPIDADDLWHPDKIARQLATMDAGGPDMGFVYTLYRRIEADDRVLTTSSVPPSVSGRVYLRLLLHNFVGNGSSLLLRRAAFDAVGGYEPALRDAGAQGLEDFLIQALVARDWTVGVVPEFLTGYRRTSGAMSEDQERMERSHFMALDVLRARHPDTPADILTVAEAAGWARLSAYRLFMLGQPIASLRALAAGLSLAPVDTLRVAKDVALRMLRQRIGQLRNQWFPGLQKPERPRFYDMDPAQGRAAPYSHPLRDRIAALEAEDAAFARTSSSGFGRSQSAAPDAALKSGTAQ